MAMLCFGVLGFEKDVLAANYYVSPNGNATWPNCATQNNPCRASNTSKAFLGAQAGDTVYFLDGIYSGLTYSEASYEYPAWNPQNSGTYASPIAFKSLNQYGAHLIGLNNQVKQHVNMIGSMGRQYIVWDGFKMSAVDTSGNPSSATARFTNASGSAIRNCEIIGHTVAWTDNREGVRIESSSNVLVENNIIHGYKSPDGNWNNAGTKQYYTNGVTFKNNEIFDNSVGMFPKNDTDNTTIINNYIHDNNKEGILISAGNEGAQGHGYTIANNIFANNAIFHIEYMNDGSFYLDDSVIHNNTFYGNVDSQVITYRSIVTAGYDPLVLYNNIFWGDTYPLRTVYNYSTIKEEDHNNFGGFTQIRLYDYGSNAATYSSLVAWKASGVLVGGGNPGEGSIAVNPQFVNSSGSMNQLSDFALASSSPCKGTGRNGADMGANVSLVGVESEGVIPPTETCSDGIQNQDETGIDCGGVCPACEVPVTYSLSNFILLVADWLGVGEEDSDVNNDGIVNTRDLGIMMSNWND